MRWFLIVLAAFLLLLSPVLSFTAESPPTVVTLNLTKDLVDFAMTSVKVGAFLLAIFAGLCLCFFGFDVRNAQKAINESVKEVKAAETEARKVAEELSKQRAELEKIIVSAEDKLNKIGATMEGLATPEKPGSTEHLEVPLPAPSPFPPSGKLEVRTRDSLPAKSGPGDKPPAAASVPDAPTPSGRAPSSLVLEVLAGSNFDWTTMTRIKRKTGLTEDLILTIANAMPNIESSSNRKTGELLFRIR